MSSAPLTFTGQFKLVENSTYFVDRRDKINAYNSIPELQDYISCSGTMMRKIEVVWDRKPPNHVAGAACFECGLPTDYVKTLTKGHKVVLTILNEKEKSIVELTYNAAIKAIGTEDSSIRAYLESQAGVEGNDEEEVIATSSQVWESK